jgi:Domain of unknown function (DUF222)
MFGTVAEVEEWQVDDCCRCEAPPELPTVWEVLAGRVPAGPAAIRVLSSVDPRDFDAASRAELVTAWEAQDSWLEAQKLSALHAMNVPVPVVNVEDPTDPGFALVPERVRAEQARLALGCSPGWAQQRIWFAGTLATRLPRTRRLLVAGRISGYQAVIAAGESQRLTEQECARFEDRVYPRGQSQTPARFRRACRLVAAGLHPEQLQTAHQRAKQDTDVTKWVEDAGMASLRLHAPAPVILEIWESCNTEARAQAAAAKQAGEEPVPIGERRVAVFTRRARTADAHLQGLGVSTDGSDAFDPAQDDRNPADLAALLDDQLSDGTDLESVSEPATEEQLAAVAAMAPVAADPVEAAPVEGSKPANPNPLGLPTGPAANVQLGVIIDLDVALGNKDGPAILQGYGPIPASMARELAADATWRRVLLEPAEGWLLDYGRTRYQPSAKLRDHLLGLGQDCRAPYCNARPKETDHGIDWAQGGSTSAQNLNGLCTHTHFLKTADGFRVTNNPDQSMTWTTPTGNTYTKPPDDLRITDYGRKPEGQ